MFVEMRKGWLLWMKEMLKTNVSLLIERERKFIVGERDVENSLLVDRLANVYVCSDGLENVYWCNDRLENCIFVQWLIRKMYICAMVD